jgi:hypothetical protein
MTVNAFARDAEVIAAMKRPLIREFILLDLELKEVSECVELLSCVLIVRSFVMAGGEINVRTFYVLASFHIFCGSILARNVRTSQLATIIEKTSACYEIPFI